MTNGYLRAARLIVRRARVRRSLRRVDPASSASRWRTVNRRTYSVPTPNSLWHLHSHMKLVRYHYVILAAKYCFESRGKAWIHAILSCINTGIKQYRYRVLKLKPIAHVNFFIL